MNNLLLAAGITERRSTVIMSTKVIITQGLRNLNKLLIIKLLCRPFLFAAFKQDHSEKLVENVENEDSLYAEVVQHYLVHTQEKGIQ